MNHTFKKVLALLLVGMLLLGTFGCKKPAKQEDASGALTMPMATDGGAPAATSSPVPAPTADASASKAFRDLDLEIFRWYVTQDGYSFHQLVTDPSVFGIDPATVPMNWGEFTEEDSKRLGAEAGVYLERLNTIQRSQLETAEQFAYDVLQQYLENASDETDYEYFYEPLTAYTGTHAEFPLSLAMYEINSAADAENYLLLLADAPRYLGQVLAYEQERAARGMFMRESALDTILADCQSIIDSKDTSFLYATFNEAVDALEGLDAITVEALKKRNHDLIENDLIDAYQNLYDGLDKLRKSCSTAVGAYALGQKGKDYFEYSMQLHGDNKLSVEETLEILKIELSFSLYTLYELQRDNPNLFTENTLDSITTGNTDSDLAMLKGIMARILPELPDHELVISTVPEELEDMLSPAMYIIPSMDGWHHNEVLINLGSEDYKSLLTLAHEAYPGHLYQYVYQRGNEELGLMQRALHYGAYAEGWSQLAEQLVSREQTLCSPAYCEYLFINSLFANVLLPAIVSILVNYYEYSEASVKTFLTSYFNEEDVDMVAEYCLDLAIDNPYYTFYYATGYSQLQQLIRDAEDDLGEAYNREAFFKAYLDLGPGYFNLLQEQMYVWIDEQMTGEADAAA